LVSIAESTIIRFIDDLKGINSSDLYDNVKFCRNEIKTLKKSKNLSKNSDKIKELYGKIDKLQFIPEYLCLIIDKNKDYLRACKGFFVNGISYKRLVGTPGGIKNSTVVFVAEYTEGGVAIRDPLLIKIDNGRDVSKELVPAKFEAYRSLTCSASIPVSDPSGVIVVNDCVTHFKSDYISLNDEQDGEPVMEFIKNGDVELDNSDGYGILLPSLAAKWSADLKEESTSSGFCIRNSFCKGMVFAFDYIDFAQSIAKKYTVIDAWGNKKDVRKSEIILTTSMLKLWDSFSSIEDYLDNCEKNGYCFSVTKACESDRTNSRELNYQFIQSYEITDDEIYELITPTLSDICGVLGGDIYKTILFLRGTKQNDNSVLSSTDDFAKALMIDQNTINDPYVRDRVNHSIQKKISNAKLGRVRVCGDYSIISGDPYALCQSIFGLEITGLIKSGCVWSEYWNSRKVNEIVCFRAPMSCHNNIRKMDVYHDSKTDYWYKYMKDAIVVNAWDTLAQAANGFDQDGDLLFTTNNSVLLKNTKNLPAIFCIQRKATKKIVTEEDLIKSNIDSFGNDIGSITNKVTAMFEVISHFKTNSPEYKILQYRIMCGQLFQQNSIDKTKGIIAKSMPEYWYSFVKAKNRDDANPGEVKNVSIVASKNPYFMNFRYSSQKKQYNDYLRAEDLRARRLFDIPFDILSGKKLVSNDENEFLEYHYENIPVGIGNCVMNRLCRAIEDEILEQKSLWSGKCSYFDYSVYKSDCEYSKEQFKKARNMYENFHSKWCKYVAESKKYHYESGDIIAHKQQMVSDLKIDFLCDFEEKTLCNILLDITYGSKKENQFVWDICGDTIIKNLLSKNENRYKYPTLDEYGNIEFEGNLFSVKTIGGD